MNEGQRALRRAIRKRGITLDMAGALLGVDYKSIWRWVHGETRPPLEFADRIEREFGVGCRLWLSEVDDNLAGLPMTEDTPP